MAIFPQRFCCCWCGRFFFLLCPCFFMSFCQSVWICLYSKYASMTKDKTKPFLWLLIIIYNTYNYIPFMMPIMPSAFIGSGQRRNTSRTTTPPPSSPFYYPILCCIFNYRFKLSANAVFPLCIHVRRTSYAYILRRHCSYIYTHTNPYKNITIWLCDGEAATLWITQKVNRILF